MSLLQLTFLFRIFRRIRSLNSSGPFLLLTVRYEKRVKEVPVFLAALLYFLPVHDYYIHILDFNFFPHTFRHIRFGGEVVIKGSAGFEFQHQG